MGDSQTGTVGTAIVRTAVVPGSFDPVTRGHLDIIRRAAALFDRVVVLVASNREKNPLFTQKERVELLCRVTAPLPNVEVECFGGLLAGYVREHRVSAIVKGLRAVTDFEYEFQMALVNRQLEPLAETVFLTASVENQYLSSSVVKQIASFGGPISQFVPEEICGDVYSKIESWNKNTRKG